MQCLEYTGKVYVVGYMLGRAFPVKREVRKAIQDVEDVLTPAGQFRLNYLMSTKLPAAEASPVISLKQI